MMHFRRIENFHGLQRGYDGAWEFLSPFIYALFGNRTLFVVVRHDRAAVLGADVVPLAIKRGWIVALPKHTEQLVVADLFWVEMNLHHLGVARGALTHFAVSGVFNCAARVAADHFTDARQPFKHCLKAPKTTASNCGNFRFHRLLLLRCRKGARPGQQHTDPQRFHKKIIPRKRPAGKVCLLAEMG